MVLALATLSSVPGDLFKAAKEQLQKQPRRSQTVLSFLSASRDASRKVLWCFKAETEFKGNQPVPQN
jgi:hypothetical protein